MKNKKRSFLSGLLEATLFGFILMFLMYGPFLILISFRSAFAGPILIFILLFFIIDSGLSRHYRAIITGRIFKKKPLEGNSFAANIIGVWLGIFLNVPVAAFMATTLLK